MSLTNPPSSTPETTIREQLEDIIVDTSLHPVKASLLILALWSNLITEARPEKLRPEFERSLKVIGYSEQYVEAFNRGITEYETNLRKRIQ